MKKFFLFFLSATFVFAANLVNTWDDGEIVLDQSADTLLSTDDFVVEAIFPENISDEESASDEKVCLAEENSTLAPDFVAEALVSQEFVFETVDELLGDDDDGLPKILFTISEDAQIICEFINSSGEKIIEFVCITGNSVLEILAGADENLIKIPSGRLGSGIYIVRILSPNTRNSLFSKAIVIG
jgi:hypothetical protein